MNKLENEYIVSLHLYQALKEVLKSEIYNFLKNEEELSSEDFRRVENKILEINDIFLQSLLYEVSIVDGKLSKNEEIYCERLLDHNNLFKDVVNLEDWLNLSMSDTGAYQIVCNALILKNSDPSIIETYKKIIKHDNLLNDIMTKIILKICCNLSFSDGNFSDEELNRIEVLVKRYFID